MTMFKFANRKRHSQAGYFFRRDFVDHRLIHLPLAVGPPLDS